MKPNQSKIFVNFCAYMPYEHFPDTCINLGQINTTQLNQLMDALARNSNLPHTCIQTMSVEFSDTMALGKMPGTHKRYRILNLSDMFYFYDVCTPKFRAPCIQGPRLPQTSDAMVRTCAHKLRCGGCRDEFIRSTLGALLFPQYYANKKQKIRK